MDTSRFQPDNAAWKASDFFGDEGWTITLTAEQIADLENARRVAAGSGRTWQKVTKDQFPLTTMKAVIGQVNEAIRNGRGFSVIRGVPVERYSIDDLQLIYWGIGSHLGQGMPQYRDGTVIGHVRDIRNTAQGARVRGSLTAENLAPHTDACDVIGLFCVRKAKSGGMSSVVSSVTVFQTIAMERPDLVPALLDGYVIYRRGEGTRDSEGGFTDYRIPVFDINKGRVSSIFIPAQIEQAMKEGLEVTALEREALQYMHEVINRPELRVDMLLEPGDIQFVNNLTVYHSRTDFVDHDEPDQKRLLMRLWLNLFGESRASPRLAEIARRKLLAGYGEMAA